MNKTKRKIFETSMKLFAEKGYDATSIEEITATVGVAKGTLYYHFSSKEEIFNFLVEEGIKLLQNSIDIKTDLNFKLNVIKECEIKLIESVNETETKNKESFSIIIYYAKVGDTLWNIAKRFGSTVDEIVKVNSIENPDLIMPGEQLFIPR